MERKLLLLFCLQLLLPEVYLLSTSTSTQVPEAVSSSPGLDNLTTPEYWNCCGYQRVPGSDPLAGLYTLYFGSPPELLPQCR